MAVNPFALPASSIALLFTLALGFTDAKPYAQPVETLVYRADEWSPRPTGVPNEPSKLFKRSSLDVAICGWLGGIEASPAQCSSGSSCVHDTIHGVVGCCTTAGACLQGVYTTCLDYKSAGWASRPVVKNDGVTNCPGTAQCYRNMYPGQYFQYSCGDPASATAIETAYAGKPDDARLQVVFTGVTYNPSVTISGGDGPVVAATATAGSQAGSDAGGISPQEGKATAETPTGSKADAGTVAGGTVGGVAGVALVGAILFYLLRRRSNKNNQRRRFGSKFFEKKQPFVQPFEPIAQSYNNPDDYVTPMTGRLDNTHRYDRGIEPGFSDDTGYRGGGGMEEADIGHANPFTDNAERSPPLPPGPGGYTDLSRDNPFSDRYERRRSPPKPLSQRAYANIPPRLAPSPIISPDTSDPMRARTMPIVNEMDTEDETFSRTWAKATREYGFDGDQSSEEDESDSSDDDSEHGHILIANTGTVVSQPSVKTLDRDVQSESIRIGNSSDWEGPHLRTMRSDISSMHNSPERRAINSVPGAMPYQKHNASNSSISTYQETVTPSLRTAPAIRPAHPLEQEQSLLDDDKETAPGGRERLNSDATTYSAGFGHSRESSRSSLRPAAAKTSVKDKRVSFDLNGSTNDSPSGSDGWRGSGIDGQGYSPAWSGIGGGWLETQSGVMAAMPALAEVPTPDEEPHELEGSGPHLVAKRPSLPSVMHSSTSTVKRRPVSSAPVLNSSSQGLQPGHGSQRSSQGSFYIEED